MKDILVEQSRHLFFDNLVYEHCFLLLFIEFPIFI
jgi:hypothetical protein